MRTMEMHDYVKEFCDGKWLEFKKKEKENKVRLINFEFAAYYDISTYRDVENNVDIIDRFYIGD